MIYVVQSRGGDGISRERCLQVSCMAPLITFLTYNPRCIIQNALSLSLQDGNIASQTDLGLEKSGVPSDRKILPASVKTIENSIFNTSKENGGTFFRSKSSLSEQRRPMPEKEEI